MSAPRRELFHYPAWGAALIVAPILVYFCGDLLYGLSGFHAHIATPPVVGCKWVRVEAAARAWVLTAFFVVISISFFITTMCIYDLRRTFDRGTIRRFVKPAVLLAAFLIASFTLTSTIFGQKMPNADRYVGGNFFAKSLAFPSVLSGESVACQSGKPIVIKDTPSSLLLLDLLRNLTRAMQMCLVVAVPATIVGAISCVAKPNPKAGQRAKLAALQRRRLRAYLNAAAALLTTGMLFMGAWLRWPLFILGDSKPETAIYITHVDAIALYFGVNYSLVIASYYLPISFILNLRASSAEDQGGPLWLTRLPAESLGKALTILAPTFAALLPALFDSAV